MAWSASAVSSNDGLTLAQTSETAYRIVRADDASPAERTAAEELRNYLQQVTGATFTVVDEADINGDGPRIFVGAGSAVKTLLPDQDWDDLGADGIVIKTVGNDLILAGGRPRGTLYAVYAFLEDTVGCRFWTATESTLPDQPTLTIPPQNVVYKPAFPNMREHHATGIVKHPQFGTRMREYGPYIEQTEPWGGRYLQLRCAFNDLLPVDEYFDAHPEWYTDARNGDVPCTAESMKPINPKTWQVDTTNPEVVEAFAAKALERVRANPAATTLAVWANDNPHYCKCDNCAALVREQGSASALMLRFVNQVAARIHAEYPDLLVEMQAYWWTVEPPKTMRAGKNVIIDLAIIGADFGHPLVSDSEWNVAPREEILGWSKVTPQLHVWYYVTNFRWSLFPHPNLYALGPDLRLFHDHHVTGIFEQGNTHSGGAGDFIQLRTWLLSKLMWDPRRDPEALIQEFMRGYYGAAGPYLKQYIDLVHESYLDRGYLVNTYNTDFTFMTLDVVNQGLELFRQAAEAVAGDEALSARVRRERMSLDAVVLAKFNYLHRQAQVTGTPFVGPDDLEAAIAAFEQAAQRFDVTHWAEGNVTLAQGLAEVRSRQATGHRVELPEFAQAYPAEDVIDYQPEDIHLYAKGTLTDVVKDPNASDGTACMAIGHDGEQLIQVRIGPYLSSHHWHVYALARLDMAPGAAPSGVGLSGGVKDLTQRKMTATYKFDMAELAGDEYQLLDLGVHQLDGGKEVRFSPPGTRDVKAVYIDRIIFIRAPLPASGTGEVFALVTEPGDRELRNNGTGDFKGSTGFEFTVGSRDLTVTALGIYDAPGNTENRSGGAVGDGLEQSAAVGIYRVSDQALVAQATVPAGAGATLDEGYRYADLEEPVVLPAGGVYRIVIGVGRGGNGFLNYERGGAEVPRFNGDVIVSRRVYFTTEGDHTATAFPDGSRTGTAFSGPNVKYRVDDAEDGADENSAARLEGQAALPGDLVLAESFENLNGQLPEGWVMWPEPGNGRSVTVAASGADETGSAMRVVRDQRLWIVDERAAMTWALPEPVDRAAIEFDVKWRSHEPGFPAFRLFTFAPDRQAASQVELQLRHGMLEQYGGIVRGWADIPTSGDKIGKGQMSPWYRIRVVADRASDSLDIYVSEPGKAELPDEPTTTVSAYGLGRPIAAIGFGVVGTRTNEAWIDNVAVRVGSDIPAPQAAPAGPNLTDAYPLWRGDPFPRTFEDIEHPEGIEHHIVTRLTRGWGWHHGAAVEYHEGKLYVTWGANQGGENSTGEVVKVAESADGGATWSKPHILAPGGEGYSNSHGTLLSHEGTLWSFNQHWAGGWDNPLATEAFTLNEQTGEWESRGVVATQGWPLDRPKRTADGNWIMGVSGFKMWKPAVMITHGGDLTRWDTVAITDRKSRFPETSVIVDGDHVLSITRWRPDFAMVSTSTDGGRTWAPIRMSNLPMTTSKPDAGLLSTGQWYAVINMRDRDALMLVVGKPGEKGFSKVYKVRYGSPTEPGYPYKGAFPRSYSYPYAVEHDGKLYVVYSVSKADIELAIIPVASLATP